jgi:CheY-like chemotaxis protein
MADDDADIRKICHLSLSAVGKWQVFMAANGTDAIEKAREEVPDVILLDVMMPGTDGVTAYHRMKEIPALANVPVIMITAKVQQDELDKYTSLGVAGVIMKPFDPMRLPAEVLRILSGRFQTIEAE